MSEQENNSGAVTDQAAGGQSGNDEGSQEQQAENKTVPWQDHKRAIDDMHKFKSEVRDLRSKLGSIESERLKEKEDYKALAERYKAERDDFESKYTAQGDAITSNARFNAVRAAALKAGLRADAEDDLDLLDLSQIEVEQTTGGRTIVHGAEGFIDDLKKRKPYWFETKKVPNINRGGASGGDIGTSDELTAEKYVELERKFKRENKPEELKKLNKRFQEQQMKKQAARG